VYRHTTVKQSEEENAPGAGLGTKVVSLEKRAPIAGSGIARDRDQMNFVALPSNLYAVSESDEGGDEGDAEEQQEQQEHEDRYTTGKQLEKEEHGKEEVCTQEYRCTTGKEPEEKEEYGKEEVCAQEYRCTTGKESEEEDQEDQEDQEEVPFRSQEGRCEYTPLFWAIQAVYGEVGVHVVTPNSNVPCLSGFRVWGQTFSVYQVLGFGV